MEGRVRPNHGILGPNHKLSGPNHGLSGPNHEAPAPKCSISGPKNAKAGLNPRPSHEVKRPICGTEGYNPEIMGINHGEAGPNHEGVGPNQRVAKPNPTMTGAKHRLTEKTPKSAEGGLGHVARRSFSTVERSGQAVGRSSHAGERSSHAGEGLSHAGEGLSHAGEGLSHAGVGSSHAGEGLSHAGVGSSHAGERSLYLLRGLVACQLCSYLYSDPRVLPCQHTFCLSCLTTAAADPTSNNFTVYGSFRCPTCREAFRLPSVGVAGLPPDFRVAQFRELLNNVDLLPHPDPSVTHPCDVCFSLKKSSAVARVLCVQCAHFMCKTCEAKHAQHVLFRHHVTVSCESSGLRCVEHHEIMQYMCKSCGIALCCTCVFTSHSGHQISCLAPPSPDQRDAVKDLVQQLDASRRHILMQREELRALQEVVSTVCEATRSEISARAQERVKQVREAEAMLLTEVDMFRAGSLGRIRAKHREADLHLGELESMCEHVEELSQPAAALQLAAQYDILTASMNRLREELVCAPLNDNLRQALQFVPAAGVTLGSLDSYVLPQHNIMQDSVDSACFGSDADSLASNEVHAPKNCEQPKKNVPDNASVLASGPSSYPSANSEQRTPKNDSWYLI